MRGAIILVLALAACGVDPKHRTGKEEIDLVLATVDPEGTCVCLYPKTQIGLKDTEDRKNLWITADKFRDPAATIAANKIAAKLTFGIDDRPPNFIGKGNWQDCKMLIGRPAYSDDFAFVYFENPEAERGAVALRKVSGHWMVVERVQLAPW